MEVVLKDFRVFCYSFVCVCCRFFCRGLSAFLVFVIVWYDSSYIVRVIFLSIWW